MSIEQIVLELIEDSPYQCRSSYSTTAIDELAHSIKEIGLRQVPEARLVNGKYQLAFGHMRLRAVRKMAKQDKTITTMLLDIKEIPDDLMCLISLEENIRRQDITPIDIARSVDLFMNTFPDSTETELARRLKMTQGHVSNMRRVLRLSPEVLAKVEEGKINFTMARELLVFEGKTGIGSDTRWDNKAGKQVANEKDANWLMLEAIKGVSGQWGAPPATVDGIKKAIYRECIDHFRHVYTDGSSYSSRGHNPLFDTKAAGCMKCTHMIRANETKAQVRQFCTNAACWDKLQSAHIKAQATAANKEMKADIAKRINTQEKEKTQTPAEVIAEPEAHNSGEAISQEIPPTYAACWDKLQSAHIKAEADRAELEDEATYAAEEAAEELEEAQGVLDAPYLEKTSELAIDDEVAIAIPDEQRDAALRTWANFQNDPRECCCRSCINAGICDGRPKTLFSSGEVEKWVCGNRMAAGSIEAVSKKAQEDLPDAFKDLDKNAAGTRAEILDILALRVGSFGSELKQGHVWLNSARYGSPTTMDVMENSEECLNTCTKGFHYGFDSSSNDKQVLYICTDPKCVSRKKSAFTRAQNALANAKKKAETSAIKEAVGATTSLDKPRMILILTATRRGRHANSYSYQPKDWENQMAKMLGFELVQAVYGSEAFKQKEKSFQDAMEKLTEEELAKILVHFMLLMLSFEGEIKDYKIQTTDMLNNMGIGINIKK